jgi:DHA1 family bicyclomycin/chloramphenicol resistance-like MFS transporter
MGFVQMGLGAGAGMIVGHGIQHSATPLALMVAVSMLFSLGVWWFSLRTLHD